MDNAEYEDPRWPLVVKRMESMVTEASPEEITRWAETNGMPIGCQIGETWFAGDITAGWHGDAVSVTLVVGHPEIPIATRQYHWTESDGVRLL